MTLTTDEYQSVLKHDFMSFIERAFYELNAQTPFLPAPHIEVIAAKLEACRSGKIRRLIINLPPRHFKSHCASVAFPAWVLGHDPAAQLICVSYGQELADKFARDTRSIMLSAWYRRLFPTRLADRHAVYDFVTTRQGTRMATSVGGVLTGRGADIIIIDDPIKPEDALSAPRRTSANEWYDHSLLSRLNDKANGCIIIIMQRLHQVDLVGHVLEQGDWEVLSFPAIAEKDETHVIETIFGRSAFKRTTGDVLHPEREPRAILEAIRRTIGEYNFSCQYQQNPMPLGGAMIKQDWLKSYASGEEPAHFDEIIQSWDTANKASELSDFSVCTSWGIKNDFCYLLHVFRARLNYPDLRRKVKELAEHFHADTVVIEDKASGTQLIQDLKSDGVFCVEPYEPAPGSDKIMRLHAQTAIFEGGRVLLPSEAGWLGDYVNELTGFPGTRYDDQVDSTAQALDYMRKSSDLRIMRKLGQMGPNEGFDAIGRFYY
ncbi:MAG TPA: phage terminase large subunit [Stellaceae bacterium]|nr:phage terminase large subunit [Stellaceae bacterium]